MMSRKCVLVLIPAFFLCLSVSAEPNKREFINSVNEGSALSDELRQLYSFRQHVYMARQYELIAIDTEVLRSEKTFSIPLFENQRAVVSIDSSRLDMNGLVTIHEGRILEPILPISNYLIGGRSITEAERDRERDQTLVFYESASVR